MVYTLRTRPLNGHIASKLPNFNDFQGSFLSKPKISSVSQQQLLKGQNSRTYVSGMEVLSGLKTTLANGELPASLQLLQSLSNSNQYRRQCVQRLKSSAYVQNSNAVRYFSSGNTDRNFHNASTSAHGTQKRNIIVQKFGGTSLGTAQKLEKVTNIIKQFHKYRASSATGTIATSETRATKSEPNVVGTGDQVVVVVSAFSSETKAEGTTTRLLNAAAAAANSDPFSHFLDRIEDTHMDIIYSMLKTKAIRDDAKRFVGDELGRVRQFCDSLSVIQELSPRSHDLIIGCGERLAAGVLAHVLRESGLNAVPVDLSFVFPHSLPANSHAFQNDTKEAFRKVILPLIDNNVGTVGHKGTVPAGSVDTKGDTTTVLPGGLGVVPVVTGYFGYVRGGIIKGVGRGYSDLTAALCAGAVGAKQLQVWKESDGVFTGNPTKIKNAKLLNLVAPVEAAELTHFGNEVLHPFTMACAIGDNVPIAILNTFKPDGLGTRIVPAKEEELKNRPGKYGIVAICSKNNIHMLNVNMTNIASSNGYGNGNGNLNSAASNQASSSSGGTESYEQLSRVFGVFAANKVKADLICTSMNNLTVTLHESTGEAEIKRVQQQLGGPNVCEVEKNKAIVSCIGQGMRHQMGLAAKVFDCLSKSGINIEMISQGASEINISVVVDDKDMNNAIQVLHQTFMEDK